MKLQQSRHKERHIDQWNGIESLEINPYICGQLISDKGPEIIHWGKQIVFSTNGSGTTGYPHAKE